MSILSAGIFVLCISLTIAVQLDGSCMNETQCDGPNMTCAGKKCQCKTPWYEPCNSKCELHSQFVYEGHGCLATENCVPNTKCMNGTCKCDSGYIAKNGLCLKSLNTTCQNNDECWSNYCSGLQCICPPDSESRDDNTCQRKFVDVYNNWNEANATGAFCVNEDSCLDILADCYNDSVHPTKNFCKCPIGYQIVEKRCDAIKGELLSPLDVVPLNYGECGVCDDKNAACILASNETTCWCRAGYRRNEKECVKDRPQSMMIFPNVEDLQMHNFTSGCLNEISNQICVCAPGYEFVQKNEPCKKIQLNWENNLYEYGVCTRISSRDDAKGENGVCPEPLKCEARNDKHVCSCGVDKFRDIDDPSQCVYFLGKTKGSAPADRCPTKNAKANSVSNVCECDLGYKAVNENRQCELILSAETSQTNCSSDRSNDSVCTRLFGIKSFLCTIGECRCSGNDSFANKEKTACYAPLNRVLADPKENCPSTSKLVGGRCECLTNYQASANLRECVRLTPQLISYKGPAINTSVGLNCQDFFTGPVDVYDKNLCQCRSNAFINDENNGCWYQLNVQLSTGEGEFCPRNSTPDGSNICQCDFGYTPNGGKCVKKTNRVFNDNDPNAVNVSGITDRDCRALFSPGAIKSSKGDYCICNFTAYPVNGDTYCYFLLDIFSGEFKNSENCPANTDLVSQGQNFQCTCKAGYVRSSDNKTCETTTIELVGTTEQMGTENCTNFSDDDCIVKYGAQAFCKDQQCYCNRRLSFKNSNGQCESFGNYVYPGEHELNAYACTSDQDCGGQANVICDYFNQASGYKVCKCQDGTYLNPVSQTCEIRCTNCRTDLNFECRGYECQCKNGYYLNGTRCVEFSLQLYQQCNATIFREYLSNNSMICNSTCNRAQCNAGYGVEDSHCARYQLGKDSCVYRDSICESIDRNAMCVREENHCSCRTGYYQRGETCAQAVGSDCREDEECGIRMKCQAKRCACGTGQVEQESNDILGRPISICVDVSNGLDRIRFQPVLLVFFLLARLFFI